MFDILFKGKFLPYGEIYNWVGSQEQLDKYDELKKEETQDLKVLAVVENRNNFDIVVIKSYIIVSMTEESQLEKANKRVKYLWLGNPYGLVKKFAYRSKQIDIPSLTQEQATLREIFSKAIINNSYFSNAPYLVEVMSFGTLGEDYIISNKCFRTNKFIGNDDDGVSFAIDDLEVQFYISKENQLEYGLWNTENYRKEERSRDMRYGIWFRNITFYTSEDEITYTWNEFKTLMNKNDARIIKKLVRKDLLKSFLIDKINQP